LLSPLPTPRPALSSRARFCQSISRTAATSGIIVATDHRYRHRQPL
jgi:hypothetical protein